MWEFNSHSLLLDFEVPKSVPAHHDMSTFGKHLRLPGEPNSKMRQTGDNSSLKPKARGPLKADHNILPSDNDREIEEINRNATRKLQKPQPAARRSKSVAQEQRDNDDTAPCSENSEPKEEPGKPGEPIRPRSSTRRRAYIIKRPKSAPQFGSLTPRPFVPDNESDAANSTVDPSKSDEMEGKIDKNKTGDKGGNNENDPVEMLYSTVSKPKFKHPVKVPNHNGPHKDSSSKSPNSSKEERGIDRKEWKETIVSETIFIPSPRSFFTVGETPTPDPGSFCVEGSSMVGGGEKVSENPTYSQVIKTKSLSKRIVDCDDYDEFASSDVPSSTARNRHMYKNEITFERAKESPLEFMNKEVSGSDTLSQAPNVHHSECNFSVNKNEKDMPKDAEKSYVDSINEKSLAGSATNKSTPTEVDQNKKDDDQIAKECGDSETDPKGSVFVPPLRLSSLVNDDNTTDDESTSRSENVFESPADNVYINTCIVSPGSQMEANAPKPDENKESNNRSLEYETEVLIDRANDPEEEQPAPLPRSTSLFASIESQPGEDLFRNVSKGLIREITDGEQNDFEDKPVNHTGGRSDENNEDSDNIPSDENEEPVGKEHKIDFNRQLNTQGLYDPLPDEVDSEEMHPVKKKHNPISRFFARKKGKYNPSTDLQTSSSMPEDGEAKKEGAKKKKSSSPKLLRKKGKDKSKEKKTDNSKAGKATDSKKEDHDTGKDLKHRKLNKENIVVIKSSGKSIGDCYSEMCATVPEPFDDQGDNTTHSDAKEDDKSSTIKNIPDEQFKIRSKNKSSGEQCQNLSETEKESDYIYANCTSDIKDDVIKNHGNIKDPMVKPSDSILSYSTQPNTKISDEKCNVGDTDEVSFKEQNHRTMFKDEDKINTDIEKEDIYVNTWGVDAGPLSIATNVDSPFITSVTSDKTSPTVHLSAEHSFDTNAVSDSHYKDGRGDTDDNISSGMYNDASSEDPPPVKQKAKQGGRLDHHKNNSEEQNVFELTESPLSLQSHPSSFIDTNASLPECKPVFEDSPSKLDLSLPETQDLENSDGGKRNKDKNMEIPKDDMSQNDPERKTGPSRKLSSIETTESDDELDETLLDAASDFPLRWPKYQTGGKSSGLSGPNSFGIGDNAKTPLRESRYNDSNQLDDDGIPCTSNKDVLASKKKSSLDRIERGDVSLEDESVLDISDIHMSPTSDKMIFDQDSNEEGPDIDTEIVRSNIRPNQMTVPESDLKLETSDDSQHSPSHMLVKALVHSTSIDESGKTSSERDTPEGSEERAGVAMVPSSVSDLKIEPTKNMSEENSNEKMFTDDDITKSQGNTNCKNQSEDKDSDLTPDITNLDLNKEIEEIQKHIVQDDETDDLIATKSHPVYSSLSKTLDQRKDSSSNSDEDCVKSVKMGNETIAKGTKPGVEVEAANEMPIVPSVKKVSSKTPEKYNEALVNLDVNSKDDESKTKHGKRPAIAIKPPSWKMKSMLRKFDSTSSSDSPSPTKSRRPKFESQRSEESINKNLIEGALKELDDFIDNDFEDEEKKDATLEEDSEKLILREDNVHQLKSLPSRKTQGSKEKILDKYGGKSEVAEDLIIKSEKKKNDHGADIFDTKKKNDDLIPDTDDGTKLVADEHEEKREKAVNTKPNLQSKVPTVHSESIDREVPALLSTGSIDKDKYEEVVDWDSTGIISQRDANVVSAAVPPVPVRNKPEKLSSSSVMDMGYEDVVDKITDNGNKDKNDGAVSEHLNKKKEPSTTTKKFHFPWKKKDKDTAGKKHEKEKLKPEQKAKEKEKASDREKEKAVKKKKKNEVADKDKKKNDETKSKTEAQLKSDSKEKPKVDLEKDDTSKEEKTRRKGKKSKSNSNGEKRKKKSKSSSPSFPDVYHEIEDNGGEKLPKLHDKDVSSKPSETSSTSSSSGSSSSSEESDYEPVNYVDNETTVEKRHPYEDLENKERIKSADSNGYEIPARASPMRHQQLDSKLNDKRNVDLEPDLRKTENSNVDVKPQSKIEGVEMLGEDKDSAVESPTDANKREEGSNISPYLTFKYPRYLDDGEIYVDSPIVVKSGANKNKKPKEKPEGDSQTVSGDTSDVCADQLSSDSPSHVSHKYDKAQSVDVSSGDSLISTDDSGKPEMSIDVSERTKPQTLQTTPSYSETKPAITNSLETEDRIGLGPKEKEVYSTATPVESDVKGETTEILEGIASPDLIEKDISLSQAFSQAFPSFDMTFEDEDVKNGKCTNDDKSTTEAFDDYKERKHLWKSHSKESASGDNTKDDVGPSVTSKGDKDHTLLENDEKSDTSIYGTSWEASNISLPAREKKHNESNLNVLSSGAVSETDQDKWRTALSHGAGSIGQNEPPEPSVEMPHEKGKENISDKKEKRKWPWQRKGSEKDKTSSKALGKEEKYDIEEKIKGKKDKKKLNNKNPTLEEAVAISSLNDDHTKDFANDGHESLTADKQDKTYSSQKGNGDEAGDDQSNDQDKENNDNGTEDNDSTFVTKDAIASVFQIPDVQSLSEISDERWRDYSPIELGKMRQAKEASLRNNILKNSLPNQSHKPGSLSGDIESNKDTAQRTNSLTVPPVPKARASKQQSFNSNSEFNDLSDEPTEGIYSDATSSPVNKHKHTEWNQIVLKNDESTKTAFQAISPGSDLESRYLVNNNLGTEDKAKGTSTDTDYNDEEEGVEYDHLPVRIRRISSSKIAFQPVMAAPKTSESAVLYTPTEKKKKGESSIFTEKTEYAAPWEEKSLESLTPPVPPRGVKGSNSELSRHDPFGGSNLSLAMEETEKGSKVKSSPGTLHKAVSLDYGLDAEKSEKHSSKDDRKGLEDDKGDEKVKKAISFRSITSLFNRKKKNKQDTAGPNSEDNHEDDESETQDSNDGLDDGKGKKKKSKKEKNAKTSQENVPIPTKAKKPKIHEKPAKPEKLKKTGKQKQQKHLDDAPQPVGIELVPGEAMEGRPLCRLLRINEDETRTVELIRPHSGPLGVFFTKGQDITDEGLFVNAFLDKANTKLFAGILCVGDEILEIDGCNIRHMTLDEVRDIIQVKERMIIRIMPVDVTSSTL